MTGLGSKALDQYLATGKPLTKTTAIKAKCAECMANYVDGRLDCEMPKCPLYPFMSYKGKTAKIEDEFGGSGV